MDRLVAWIDALTDRVASFGAWLVVPLFLIMGYEVFARFVLGWPTFWSWEVAYMITGSHFILGIAYVTKTRQHVRVDFIYANLPPRGQAAIDGAIYAFFLLPVTMWMTWRLGGVAIEAFRIGETSGESAWNPVIWPVRAIVAVGFGLFAIQILAEAIRSLRFALGRERQAAK
ncbi:MAG: TRAP transporter small permease subunit [Pseudomonadota bacterium]